MTKEAIDGLQREHQRALELIGTLTPEEWAAASGCEGWRVQDVVQHMGATFHSIADPSTIEGGTSQDVEENAEVPVQARRDWSTDQVVAEYVEWSANGLAALSALQEPPLADTVIPLANLGHHPMHLLANAIAFDHYCHLRHDIGAAIPRAAELPRDEGVLAATLEWMLAGIPEMCALALSTAPRQPVALVFSDPASEATLTPDGDGWAVVPGRDPEAPAVLTSVHDFVSWGTKRSDWRELAVFVGEGPSAEDAAAVLDAINVI
jgi:uncharacterized protein (TIGR03083 family)